MGGLLPALFTPPLPALLSQSPQGRSPPLTPAAAGTTAPSPAPTTRTHLCLWGGQADLTPNPWPLEERSL